LAVAAHFRLVKVSESQKFLETGSTALELLQGEFCTPFSAPSMKNAGSHSISRPFQVQVFISVVRRTDARETFSMSVVAVAHHEKCDADSYAGSHPNLWPVN
jgi:hypothetical protein